MEAFGRATADGNAAERAIVEGKVSARCGPQVQGHVRRRHDLTGVEPRVVDRMGGAASLRESAAYYRPDSGEFFRGTPAVSPSMDMPAS